MNSIWIAIFCIIFVQWADAVGNKFCQSKKTHCEREQWKKNCPEVCGESRSNLNPTNGGGGDNDNPPTTTTKRITTTHVHATTSSSSSGGGGGGGESTGDTSPCDGKSPKYQMGEANQHFQTRCRAAHIPDGCVDHCKYDQDMQTLKKAFLGGPCKLAILRPYLAQASGGRDNRQCCESDGVLSQKKTGICGCFCNPTGSEWPGKGQAAKYAPCVGVLTGIMKCHFKCENGIQTAIRSP